MRRPRHGSEDGPRASRREAFLLQGYMKKDFRKAIAEEVLLADGAIGTLLTSRGALPGTARSPLNLSDPESVREAHDDYLDAGARILTTNTWDANRVKLTAHEWADSIERINREGVRLAKEASAVPPVPLLRTVAPRPSTNEWQTSCAPCRITSARGTSARRSWAGSNPSGRPRFAGCARVWTVAPVAQGIEHRPPEAVA